MAIALSFVVLALALSIPALGFDFVPILTVAGDGSVTVPADAVFVTASVTTNDDNVTSASALNAEKLNRTIEALLAVGISRDEIQSGYGRNAQTIRTYKRICNNTTCMIVEDQVINQVTDQIRVQLDPKDETTLERCLESVEAEGATAAVTGYWLDDTNSAMSEARKKAVENAKQNGEELATAAGLKLGKTLEILEPSGPRILRHSHGWNEWDEWDSFWPGMGYSEWRQPWMHRQPFETSYVDSGMVEITAYVVVTYELVS